MKKRTLSRREMQAAQRLTLNMTGPQIAEDLGIGYEAVRNYMRRARKKTGLHSQGELATMVQPSEFEELTLP